MILRVHLRALGNLVDAFLFIPQSQPDKIQIAGCVLLYRRPVRSIVAGAKHVLDIDRHRGTALDGTAMNPGKRGTVSSKDMPRSAALKGQMQLDMGL